jgi:hypothetical protein
LEAISLLVFAGGPRLAKGKEMPCYMNGDREGCRWISLENYDYD